ncbi:MAG TPA: hypothetical protein VK492_10790 [Chitinophagaceae bacterium]|nr:hypothetical protein [Chitinophagaceae bacterium]
MESFFLEQDIKIFYVTATSFPGGVMDAHQKLHSLIGSPTGRKFFGISYPETPSKIIYKAAVEESYPGEGEKLGCETFVIKKGHYISVYIKDFMKDIPKIGRSFQELLADERIDPKGCCVEEYINDKDVRCMVRLNDNS